MNDWEYTVRVSTYYTKTLENDISNRTLEGHSLIK